MKTALAVVGVGLAPSTHVYCAFLVERDGVSPTPCGKVLNEPVTGGLRFCNVHGQSKCVGGKDCLGQGTHHCKVGREHGFACGANVSLCDAHANCVLHNGRKPTQLFIPLMEVPKF